MIFLSLYILVPAVKVYGEHVYIYYFPNYVLMNYDYYESVYPSDINIIDKLLTKNED